ncbi:sulfate/molybdate ABC transporter ATP-binding protein [Gloeothece verrucosa]|uniref:ABC-type quaternary amine transporter n=1 Tax=Gloeothece verrucosa (strain PCC 7822) TaxID=497965 RepID=E0U6C8_GLOV7|nr:sulfate ABC transporter ATP-binding protein [Gloeothece verrucosa]ADN13571.1 sulfate ABC transporter, ATPase subunit [Gloeothece verrucosa PCC 7822]
MSIIIKEVSKNFGNFQALSQVSLEVKPGGLVALLGPSGSGKSTLLRAIAGLETPDSGQIIINGQDTTYLDVRKRHIGFCFQHYALFKEMTIRENIGFGLKIRKYTQAQIQQRVDELLDLIQLQGLGERYPSQLSGGQKQRVALARALAVHPEVLLLDEPFGALDAKIRKELRIWLRNLHDEVKITTVFVTHDQEEAMDVADEIVVMNHGRVEQIGKPAEIYDNPASAFVMSFIGQVNIFPGHANFLTDENLHSSQKIFVRPYDIELLTNPTEKAIQANIEKIIHLGKDIQAELITSEGLPFSVNLSRSQFEQLNLNSGQQVFVQLKNAKVFTD